MSMDTITEKIAHFVGAFQMIEEQARLRAEYDEFRAAKEAQNDAAAMDLSSFKGKNAHKLEDYDPKLELTPTTVEAPNPQGGAAPSDPLSIANLQNSPTVSATQNDVAPVAGGSSSTSASLTLPPPSSLVNVTYELNSLSDNDIFGQIVEIGFQQLESIASAFQVLAETIVSLGPIQMDLLPSSGNWMTAISEIQQSATALAEGQFGSYQTSVFLGEAAHGSFVNGELVDEFTDFNDLLPIFFAVQVEALEEQETAGHDFSDDFIYKASPFKVEDGVNVVAGANSLVNTATINSTWLDAEVIVASGDVISFNAISQTNVLIDHDQLSELIQSQDLAAQVSTAINAASQSIVSDTAEGEKGGEAAKPTLPSDWVVVHHNGPLVQVNWVQQKNFGTDFDSASITLTGAATSIGFGENILTNTFDANEIGYQYDLILVGGDITDLNLINQLNVLLDSDVVDVSGVSDIVEVSSTPAPDTGLATAGYAIAADKTVGLPEPLGVDDDPLEVADLGLEAGADGFGELDGAPTENTDGTPLQQKAFSTGDNLLYNQAQIDTVGEDTEAEITQAFSDTLDNFANGEDKVTDEVVQSDLFDGTELLRVLYIDGDFTTVNIVDQTNIFGDVDQVHLARDEFANALQSDAVLTTGSNILTNVAAVKDNGIDSTVMAQGDIYSDALLHQAELIDNDLVPMGQSISDLATEAVAFLVDDLDASQMVDSISASTDLMIADAMGQSDLMETMLS